MRAIVQDRYGGPEVLKLADIPAPVPGDDDLLLRVRAAGVDPGVRHLMTGLPYLIRLGFGLRAPRTRVRGLDVAGEVRATVPYPISGAPSPHEALSSSLEARAEGRGSGGVDRFLRAALLSPFVSQKLRGMFAGGGKGDLQILRELIEGEKLTPVIDRAYPLAEAAEAIRYLAQGRARGKVVLTV